MLPTVWLGTGGTHTTYPWTIMTPAAAPLADLAPYDNAAACEVAKRLDTEVLRLLRQATGAQGSCG